jgi:hypothetical protein
VTESPTVKAGWAGVLDVRTKNGDIGYGELAIKWDDGVVVINYPLAEEFALISRAIRK